MRARRCFDFRGKKGAAVTRRPQSNDGLTTANSETVSQAAAENFPRVMAEEAVGSLRSVSVESGRSLVN